MNKKLVLFVFLFVGTLLVAFIFRGGNLEKDIFTGEKVIVSGDIGGEKKGFFANPKVQSIFHKNGVDLQVKKEGSITMVTSPTTGKDFLSPSTNLAVDIFSENGGHIQKHETVFYSPIVVYSWKSLIPSLQKAGFVTKDTDHYNINLKQLQTHILENKKFSDLGLSDDNRYIKIYSTDPTKSNSGNMFAGLQYNILKNANANISEREILEKLGEFFDKMGFMPGSSGDIFKNFLNKGESVMMVVGYENQLIEFYKANPNYQQYIKENVVVLYPNPTVWSEHEIIALTKNGEKIINIFKENKKLEQIASEEHGFRIIGGQIQGTIELENIPKTIKNVEPLPSYKVVNKMLEFLQRQK